MTVDDILDECFNYSNIVSTRIVDEKGVTILTYNNTVIKMDQRFDDRFYMRIEVNGVRILTTTGKGVYVKQVLDDLLDSCDLIES